MIIVKYASFLFLWMILGVTGLYGAGKDSVAEILSKKNFYHISLSDIIREELSSKKLAINRDSLIRMGNTLRAQHGPDILARLALSRLKDGENYVITSIRNTSEAARLSSRHDFLFLNIVAPLKLRLQRLRERRREGDPETVSALKEKEAIENSKDNASQQLSAVAKLAKITLNNNGSLEELERKISSLLEDWLFKLHPARPDWDHYFMLIAEQVKLRCSCLSAKKGAIIVKDKMILSTGYNGSPKGIGHCYLGYCQRCRARHLGKIKSGDYSLPCICCHAEENAIVQAAYNGTSTRGAILYTTYTPCTVCAKMIINAGITSVIAKVQYPDEIGTSLLRQAGVELRVLR